MATKPIRLATPGQIGTIELKNRLAPPAMCTNDAYQGHFTDAAVDHYGLRARGGVRLMIIIGLIVIWSGKRDSFRKLFNLTIPRYFVRMRVRLNQERDWRWSS